MSDALKNLQRQTESLAAGAYALLAQIEAVWGQEIEQRAAAYDRGELQSIPAEEVYAEARRLVR